MNDYKAKAERARVQSMLCDMEITRHYTVMRPLLKLLADAARGWPLAAEVRAEVDWRKEQIRLALAVKNAAASKIYYNSKKLKETV